MSVQDFMDKYKSSFQSKPIVNPLSTSNNTNNKRIKPVKFGLNRSTSPVEKSDNSAQQTNVYGNAVSDYLGQKKQSLYDSYNRRKSQNANKLAEDVVDKSSGNIPTNEWGVVPDKLTDYSDLFKKQVSQVGQYGKIAVEKEEAKARWQSLQNSREMNAGVIANIPAGSSGKGAGSKAVAMALNVQKSGTPYKWGGNSLTGGVDCSGLVQQVYGKLGINLPRTTYEQAKRGKTVNVNDMLPGDLVFYNTGSRDPNGIGNMSHVAIYIGNNQVVHAYNSKVGITVDSVNRAGKPALGIRPW